MDDKNISTNLKLVFSTTPKTNIKMFYNANRQSESIRTINNKIRKTAQIAITLQRLEEEKILIIAQLNGSTIITKTL